MKLTTYTIAAIFCASTAIAGGNSNDQSTTNTGGTGIGIGGSQEQGQTQGQGQLQGQSQNASNSTAIKIEGGVSASIGGATCTNGLSLGIPGTGAIGFSLSDSDCKILAEADFLRSMGRPDLAMIHVQHIRRFRQTMDVVSDIVSNQITDQTYVGGDKLGTALSTRTAPVTYTACEVIGNTPHITMPYGATEEQTHAAAVACFATR